MGGERVRQAGRKLDKDGNRNKIRESRGRQSDTQLDREELEAEK